MNPALLVAIANGIIGLLETIAPQIAELVKKGEISVESQQALDARIQALRPSGGGFAGPEWKPSTTPTTPT